MDRSKWQPYVPAAERREEARRQLAKAQKTGVSCSPIEPYRGRIAKTFWGKAWCDNLERYSDYANRLPRGRSYCRNGSVIDLQIGTGHVAAMVMGSSIYRIEIDVAAVPQDLWRAVRADCSASIDSLIELLQGKLSRAVMERICAPGTGLFPTPSEIRMRCSCPDKARLCKHIAAVLYGIGARLDQQPELLFKLRRVEASELVAHGTVGAGGGKAAVNLDAAELSDVFGIEMDEQAAPKVGASAGTESPRSRKSSVSGVEARTRVRKTQPQAPATAAQAKTTRAVRKAPASTAKKATARKATSKGVKATSKRRRS